MVKEANSKLAEGHWNSSNSGVTGFNKAPA
jgi:hypothetical protein